jgi:hypothetical protein
MRKKRGRDEEEEMKKRNRGGEATSWRCWAAYMQ